MADSMTLRDCTTRLRKPWNIIESAAVPLLFNLLTAFSWYPLGSANDLRGLVGATHTNEGRCLKPARAHLARDPMAHACRGRVP
jgi:hypothetical protein